MKYTFLPKKMAAGNLSMQIVTDKTGTDEILPNRYLKSFTPPSDVFEEFLGESRIGEVTITVFDRGRKFRDDIFINITKATLLLHLDGKTIFYGDVDLEPREELDDKVYRFTAFGMLNRLKYVTIQQVYEAIPFLPKTAYSTFYPGGTFLLNMSNIQTLIIILAQKAAIGAASVTFEASYWKFGYQHPAESSFDQLWFDESFFSDDLVNYPWSFKRFSNAAELWAHLQRIFFFGTNYDMDPVSGDVTLFAKQRMNPAAALVVPSGNLKSGPVKYRQTTGVSVTTMFPEREKVFAFDFENASLSGWNEIHSVNGGQILVQNISPGHNSVYSVLFRSPIRSDFKVGMYYLFDGHRTAQLNVELHHLNGGTPSDSRQKTKVHLVAGLSLTPVFTSDLPFQPFGEWQRHAFDASPANASGILIEHDCTAFNANEPQRVLLVDDITLRFVGPPTVFNVLYGVLDRNSFELEVPFMFDGSNEVEVIADDAKRFLYLPKPNGTFQAVDRAQSSVSAVFTKFNELVGWHYWAFFGGFRKLATLRYRKITANDGSGVDVRTMKSISRVEIDDDVYGEAIGVRKDPDTNEMEVIAIERRITA